MTEASSKDVTAGPVIGGGAASNENIVNGLDGLRLLIERRQTNDRGAKSTSSGGTKKDTRSAKVDKANGAEAVKLNITDDNTILAITGKRPQIYVIDDGKLRVYTSVSVNGEVEKLNAAVNRLDANQFLIRRNRSVAGQRMLINKDMTDELSVVDGGVVYRDYLLKLNNSATEVVKAMIAQRPKKMKLAQPKADATTLLNKVTAIKRITDQAAKSEATPRDAMELFLVIGQASSKVLRELLNLTDEQSASIIDSLRRMGGIGERAADGTYPILIKNASDLIDSDDPQRARASFCAAVHREEIDGTTVVYDLDEVSHIDWADEYVCAAADYARASRNPRIERLFSGEIKQVKISRILRTLSNDGGRANFADMQFFEEAVITDVLMKGMVSLDPTDGCLWAGWQVAATDNLKESALRYLANNKEWLSAVLSADQLESLTRQIANIDFDKATDTQRNLQKVVSLQYAALVDAMRIEGDVADGQQQITIK